MFLKVLFSFFIIAMLNVSLHAGDFCSPVPITEVIGASNVLNDSSDLSSSLVLTSNNLLQLSTSLVEAGSTANREYVTAMLQLSQDILEMADKIGEMADRILYMADEIGDMADRIVETQKIQNDNVALTQTNIMEAQKNFNSILNN